MEKNFLRGSIRKGEVFGVKLHKDSFMLSSLMLQFVYFFFNFAFVADNVMLSFLSELIPIDIGD
jgi:hypothetical protein